MKYLAMIGALCFAAPLFSEKLELTSRLTIHNDHAEFGGISGINVDQNGASFLAVSDKGTIWKGEFARNADGRLEGVENLSFRPILTSKGKPVTGHQIDAEEIDRDSNGQLYISFESATRVSKFEDWEAPAQLISSPDGFAKFGFNSGPEAMCIGANDEVLVIPERSGKLETPFPIYTLKNKTWDADRNISRKPPYLVVGMDYDPKTRRIYVLERDFSFPSFSSRIRSFALSDEGTSDEQTLLETGYGEYGDLEGISLWINAQGQTMLTLVADDNFSAFYSTEIVEFLIKE